MLIVLLTNILLGCGNSKEKNENNLHSDLLSQAQSELKYEEIKFYVKEDTAYLLLKDSIRLNTELIQLKSELLLVKLEELVKDNNLPVVMKYDGFGKTFLTLNYNNADINSVFLDLKNDSYKKVVHRLVDNFTLSEILILDRIIEKLNEYDYIELKGSFVLLTLKHVLRCKSNSEYLKMLSEMLEIYKDGEEYDFQRDIKYFSSLCIDLV